MEDCSELPPEWHHLAADTKALNRSKSSHNPRCTYNKFTRSASIETVQEHRKGKEWYGIVRKKILDTTAKGMAMKGFSAGEGTAFVSASLQSVHQTVARHRSAPHGIVSERTHTVHLLPQKESFLDPTAFAVSAKNRQNLGAFLLGPGHQNIRFCQDFLCILLIFYSFEIDQHVLIRSPDTGLK